MLTLADHVRQFFLKHQQTLSHHYPGLTAQRLCQEAVQCGGRLEEIYLKGRNAVLDDFVCIDAVDNRGQ